MNLRLELGDVILIAAVMVNAPRWGGSFIMSESTMIPAGIEAVLHTASVISGALMGPIEVIGTAYLLTQLANTKPKGSWNAKSVRYEWKLLAFFSFGLLFLTMLVLTPYLAARMTGQTVATMTNMWFVYIWSAANVAAPIFVIGGIAVARGEFVGMFSEPEPASASRDEAPEKSGGKDEGADTSDGEKTSTELVLDFYSAHPRATQKSAAAAAGISRTRVSQILKDLERRGVIERNGSGVEV